MIDIENARALVKLLKEEAPDLRRAGILKLELGAVSVEMVPYIAELEHPQGDADVGGDFPRTDSLDALDDPATFGGAGVPGMPKTNTTTTKKRNTPPDQANQEEDEHGRALSSLVDDDDDP